MQKLAALHGECQSPLLVTLCFHLYRTHRASELYPKQSITRDSIRVDVLSESRTTSIDCDATVADADTHIHVVVRQASEAYEARVDELDKAPSDGKCALVRTGLV